MALSSALVALVVAAACSNDDAENVTLPERPAECAGKSDSRIEAVRLAQWRHLAEIVESSEDRDTAEALLTFSETLTASAVDDVIADVDPSGVLVAYRLSNGTTLKASFTPRDDSPIRELAEQALTRSLSSQEPADPDVATGSTPSIAGTMVAGRPAQIAEVFEEHRCTIYSASVGSDSQHPPLTSTFDRP